jgi:macrolide transport system ATP-binding/permease protein
MVAVMSYEMWKRDYAGDTSILGKTFWVNTKAVTLIGIAPAGFYGDRLSSTPPDFYLPIQSMPVLASAAYVYQPESSWLYIIGRIKPGTNLAELQEKVSALVKHSMQETGKFTSDVEPPLNPRNSLTCFNESAMQVSFDGLPESRNVN